MTGILFSRVIEKAFDFGNYASCAFTSKDACYEIIYYVARALPNLLLCCPTNFLQEELLSKGNLAFNVSPACLLPHLLNEHKRITQRYRKTQMGFGAALALTKA
jgi:hypothetical protein